MLKHEAIRKPVDVALLLKRLGLSLRKAHDALNRLVAGETVAVELFSDNAAKALSDMNALGVRARAINTPEVSVKEVRQKLCLSQGEFAVRFGFEVDTIQNWEQGRNIPDRPTTVLLKVIEHDPSVVDAALARE